MSFVLAPATQARALIVASSADDVCGAAVDPCVVSDTVSIVGGSVLDFGTRTLIVAAGGQLDTGSRTASVLCGRLSVSTAGAIAINLRDAAGGGSLSISARRSCSAAPTLACTSDVDCLGAGTCSLGSGGADLDGRVDGDATPSATFVLEAAGDINVLQPISLSGSASATTGGDIVLSSRGGSLSVGAGLDASGGGLADGGNIVLQAAGMLEILARLDASGGDLDGGTISIVGGSDVNIDGDLRADSRNGEGFGGIIDVAAAGQLALSGGSASTPRLLTADGNGAFGFGGDGGEILLSGGGDVGVGPFVSLRARGAIPDGFGGDVAIEAGGVLTIAGEVQVDARGASGAAGFIDLLAGDFELTSTGILDLTGASGGGDLTVQANGPASIDGSVDLSASVGQAGAAALFATASFSIGGSVSTAGTIDPTGPNVAVDACAVLLRAGASIDNGAVAGRNRFTGHGSVTIEAGATVLADGVGAANEIVYANPFVAPAVAGTVTPAALISLDESIGACSTCVTANDCDDGNSCTDDVCEPALGCQNLPNNAACDDGLSCTTGDVCAGAVCTGTAPAVCDDGNPCTDDGCDDLGGCIYTPNAATCDDGLACTLVDTCSGGECVGAVPAECDDFDACTRDLCDDVLGCVNQAGSAPTCLVAQKSKLKVKNSDPDSRDALSWKWLSGDAFTHAKLGDPLVDTDHTVCVFDRSGAVPVVAARLRLAAGGPWREKVGKGWQYKDKLATFDGLRKIKLKPGVQGKTKVQLSAKGDALPLPPPVSAQQMFDADPSITVQLSSTQGTCWIADYTLPQRNTPEQYKASAP